MITLHAWPTPNAHKVSIMLEECTLIYLAEKTGKFLPTAGSGRVAVLEWLMFQMANLGPIAGQTAHFRDAAPERVPYAINRFTDETARLYGVMDRRLGEVPYLAGDEYSIADMACWPWIRLHRWHGQPWEAFPNVKQWFDRIAARDAVQAGMKLLEEYRAKPKDVLNDRTRDILFGKSQFERR